ncbi:hypothetical protein [Photobacterium leiognathi]|uniref:hypothetical protein n=1 Tax=Photobacterium leiognathi TaxID=553611 RepID=UPI002739D45D|nr:hypothetical protein [Photobacterium leiognathi]
MKELDLTALVVENFNNSEINMDYLTNEHLDRDVKSATEFLDLTFGLQTSILLYT